MENERRNTVRRSAVVRGVLEYILHNPSVTLSSETLQQWLHVSGDAAERILQRLVHSGLMREVRPAVWVRNAWLCAQRPGY